MAELLIKMIDAIHDDKIKDARGSYKRGDVVCAMPDGHKWGNGECPPMFAIVKIPDMTVEEAKVYLEPEMALVISPIDNELREKPVRRRAHSFQIDDLPQDAKEDIKTKPILINKADAVAVIEQKPTVVK